MRTERPTPWGFDVWDPKLTLRQQAADAQRLSDRNMPDDHEVAAMEDSGASEPPELETIGVDLPEAV